MALAGRSVRGAGDDGGELQLGVSASIDAVDQLLLRLLRSAADAHAAREHLLHRGEVRRIALLTGESRTVPLRHRTMLATIEWSYTLLNEPDRLLFRRLSVFVGGCSYEAIEEVCSGEGIDKRDLDFQSDVALRYLEVDVTWQDGIGFKTYTLKSMRAAPENE